MKHLMTGATGFVGSAIVLELLQRDAEAEVVAIVRAREDQSPTERLVAVLHPLVEAYGLPASLHQAIDARVRAVEGDVWKSRCGVADVVGLEGCELWHCAASLQYQDRHRELIERTNVGGTAHVLELAEQVSARRVNLVSTAYVAGARTGRVNAEQASLEGVNNHYERSKVNAENLALQSGLAVRIMRPGIVIGHSQTYHALNYNGLYGFLRGLVKFRGAIDRAQPGLSERLSVRMRVDPDGELGLVPVDHVAMEAVGLSLRDAPVGIYHLTNPTPPETGETLDVTFAMAGLQKPVYVDDVDELGSLDRKLHKRVDFYNSYIINSKQFDRSSTDAVLGEGKAPGLEMPRPQLEAFCGWYAELLAAERKAMPVSR